MRDDDDALAAYDLTAWEPPPPPAALVDGVIARARETAMPALVEVNDPPRRPAVARRSRTPWWIAGGIAAAVLAVAAVGVWGIERAVKEPVRGELVADRAQTLSLGASSATVDPQAELHWRRDGKRLVVRQPRGAVAWQVDRDDTILIEAGAAVASVEASGASLRVEVQMLDRTDTRLVTGSVAISATVALVTVLVYEGSARVAHDGHTVNVVAGERYQVDPPVVLGDQLTVGSGPAPEVEDVVEKVDKQIEKKPAPPTPTPAPKPKVAATCDEVSCILDNHAGACCSKYRKPAQSGQGSPPPAGTVPDTLDREMITKAVAAIKPQIEACGASFTGNMKLHVTVAPSGDIAKTRVTGPDGEDNPSDVAACMHGAALNLPFPKTRSGGAFAYPFRFQNAPQAESSPSDPPPALAPEKKSCDVDFITVKGNALANAGMWNKALEKFEEALRCKPSMATTKRAFVAACNTKNAAKARSYYAKLMSSAQAQLAPICVRNGIDLRGTLGTFVVQTQPSAQIAVDGVDAGTTPLTMTLKAGPHKVTFVTAAKRLTYTVEIKPGQTVTWAKDLR